MFERYALYHTFDGALGAHGAEWLGWDIAKGNAKAQPDIDGLDLASVTARARKYGFHATIKAPFHLANGADEAALHAGFTTLCEALKPVTLQGLALSRIGRFFGGLYT